MSEKHLKQAEHEAHKWSHLTKNGDLLIQLWLHLRNSVSSSGHAEQGTHYTFVNKGTRPMLAMN